MKLQFSIILLLLNTVCNAQLGSWNVLNAKIDLSEKWAVFGELQLRSLKFYNDFHYYEIKGGATYFFNKNFSTSFGFGDFDTYSEGGNFKKPVLNNEFRSWVQLNMSQYLERIKFDHRYRAEQRFTSNGFKNRYRYRINAIIPLKNLKVVPKTFYLNASNEIFFTNRQPYFERNRLLFGGGYEFSNLFALQLCYIRQFDYKLTDETGKNFIQLSFLLEFDWRKKTGEKVPSSMN